MAVEEVREERDEKQGGRKAARWVKTDKSK